MNSTIKTTIHAYSFDLKIPAQKAEWESLRAILSSEGFPRCFESLGDHYAPFAALDGIALELETRHLFDDQWNTAALPSAQKKEWAENGVRVFDWSLDALFDANGRKRTDIKRGHYLVQTPEMRALRENTNACGYCGKQEPAAKGYVFCPHCLDSEYLKVDNLPLTRMLPVSQGRNGRESLTEAERAHLMPLYIKAQTQGSTERGRARIAKRRADIAAKFKKESANARAEHDGNLWLMDHGITAEPIFYSHTGRFCFGWREPLAAESVSALLELMGAEFPFPYDIKCADGRTLSGN
jgi:hypothetical protein